ncbi:hypothetical protein [Desulfovibrio sp. DV]|nr:hypothetical protein [Desulfovibrio sp. DV]
MVAHVGCGWSRIFAEKIWRKNGKTFGSGLLMAAKPNRIAENV